MTLPGGWELILVVVVIMVLFGYKRLPDATRSLGQSMRIFKAEAKGLRDGDADARDPRAAVPPPPVAPAPPAATRPGASQAHPYPSGEPGAAPPSAVPPPAQQWTGSQPATGSQQPAPTDQTPRPQA